MDKEKYKYPNLFYIFALHFYHIPHFPLWSKRSYICLCYLFYSLPSAVTDHPKTRRYRPLMRLPLRTFLSIHHSL